jgi:exodeoxyribonuclease VII large subunit
MVRDQRRGIDLLATRLLSSARSSHQVRRRALAAMAGRLDAMSPLKVLERGYSVVINSRDGRAVLDAATVQIGDQLDIRLAKGRLTARATARSS